MAEKRIELAKTYTVEETKNQHAFLLANASDADKWAILDKIKTGSIASLQTQAGLNIVVRGNAEAADEAVKAIESLGYTRSS